MAPDRAYDVGYGKPPAHSRFKKGQSGNPKGRPKGPKSLGSRIAAELKKRVTVNERHRRSKVTKREAMVLQIVKNALRGDVRALMFILKHLPKEKRKAYEIRYR